MPQRPPNLALSWSSGWHQWYVFRDILLLLDAHEVVAVQNISSDAKCMRIPCLVWMVLGIDSNRWVGWQVSDRNSFSMTRLQTGRNQGEEAATAMGPNIFSVTSNLIMPNPWSLQESFLPYEDYKLAGTKATMKNPGKLWWWESTGPLTKTPVSLALCNEGNTFKKHWFNLVSHMNSTFSLLHASFTILIPCDECSHLHHR